MSLSPAADRTPLPLPNPFGRLVGDPLRNEIDVPEINRPAFEACLRLIEGVRAQSSSGALTLLGEAGSGKTHLLGRVRRWLEGVPASLFVVARMDTSGSMLWRHLRRCLADALLRPGPSGRRALDDLLQSRQAELALLPERDLAIIFENLLKGTHVRDAEAWLRGQELPETALRRLELAEPGPDENQETASRNVVVSICSLVEPGVVVLCLDQWEALQGFVGDTSGFVAAGQAVSLLHDPPVRNVCVISSVQYGFLQTLETVLDIAVQRRMLANTQAIDPLNWDQAVKLVAARLDSVPALAEMRSGRADPLWPLTDAPIRQVFSRNRAPAARVIARSKDLFDKWATGEVAPEKPIEEALRGMLDERTLPVDLADGEAAFRNGLPVMFTALHARPAAPPPASAFDFVLNNGRHTVAVCNQANANSLASRIKKVDEAWRPAPGQRLLLLRDARLPIGATASVTRQRLAAIERSGGRLVPVSHEALAALAALRRLLADAQSGDLSYRGDGISAATVEQWIAGNLPAALGPLIAEVGAPHLLSPKLADLLSQRKIVSLEEAARELQARPEEVEACARRDPRLFGLLGGATPVLFQPAVLAGSGPAAE
jgi:hypothetical protein